MTKILHVPSGEFVLLVSSFAYDQSKKIKSEQRGRALNIEDSFLFADEHRSFSEILNNVIQGNDGTSTISGTLIGNEYEKNSLTCDEFEFIND